VNVNLNLNSRVSFRLRAHAFVAAAALLTAGLATAAETVLVQAGSSMTYLANTANPGLGTTWTAEAFTPSGWSSGSYGVGYEVNLPGAASLLATTVSTASLSVYTRATFSIADVSAVNNLFVGADYDDGYIVWINGVEVRRVSMPTGTPGWSTSATSHESSNGASPNYGTLVDISATALPVLHDGTNVMAVGVWNTGTGSSDLVLVPKLSMNVDSSVTRGPYLQLGTPSSTVVRWRTNIASNSCVRYGTLQGSLTSITCDPASTTEHVVNVTGLAADTKYYYSIGTSTGTQAGNTADHFFVTSPIPGTPKATRMWILGDSGTADANQVAVRNGYFTATGTAPTDLWLMLGDNAYNNGTDSEYQAAVFDMYPTVLRNSVLWPTLGNHDGGSADSQTQTGPYYASFTLPGAAQAGGVASGTEAYYSFDYGDIHFICLDSYDTDRSAGGTMMTWLAADLADTTANWIIAFFHHPPYSKGSHDSDSEARLVDMRQNALPILEAGGADLVLTGHSHSYERSFLLDGHYGLSSTLTSGMKLDPGDGRDAGTGPYLKMGGGPMANDGAVYVVAGSSGQIDSGPLNHPAMYVSMSVLGSMILEVDGDRLDARFIDSSGTTRDSFAMEKVSPPAVCGNGTVEGTEDCDDGNALNTDACLDDCTVASCGDGFVRAGFEECDDANAVNTDACLNTCVSATCGDGVVRAGVEECDDANGLDTDACLNTCVNAGCGDGFVRTGVEQCDDANAVNTDACLNTCFSATCGDGVIRAGVEQ
jgi:cysteine-rich repeat protein